MHSPLFSILSGFKSKALTLAGKKYSYKTKVSAENHARFHILRLPEQRESMTPTITFDSADQHLTFFETQKETEGYRSAYHYTSILRNRNETGPNYILIHLYFNRFDQVCMSPQVWSYDIERSCKISLLTDFFSKQDSDLFIRSTIDCVMPLIIELRTHQQDVVRPLDEQYKMLSQEMVELSKHQTSEWDPYIKAQFLDRLDRSFPILQSLCLYSDQTDKFKAVIRIYETYKDVLERKNAAQVHEKRVETVMDEEIKDDKLPYQRSSTRAVNVLSQVDKKTKFLIQRSNALISSKVCLETDARMLETCLKKLDAVFTEQKFSENDTFEILGAMLAIRQKLTAYCISQMLEGNTEGAILFYDYLIEIPTEVLNHCIQVDDSKTLKSLLDYEKILVNTVLTDGHTVGSIIVHYESVKCLFVLLNKDISLMAIYSRLFLSVYDRGQLDFSQLEMVLTKLVRVGTLITQHVSYEMMRSMLDNNIKFLTDILNKPSQQIIKRKNNHAHTIQNDTSFDLLRCLIEVTKLMKFFINSMTKSDFEQLREMSLDEQYKKLVAPGKLDASTLMDLSTMLPYLKQVLPLLESLNQQLEGLSAFHKQGLKNRLLSCITHLFDLSKGRCDQWSMLSSFMELLSYCSQRLSLPDTELVKLKLMLGMEPTDDFMPVITSVVSLLSSIKVPSSSLSFIGDPSSSTRFFRQPTRPENCIGWCQPPDGSYDDEKGNTLVPK